MYRILLIILLLTAACELTGGDEEDDIPFDAGPILFIYNGQLWSMEEDGSDVRQLTHYKWPDFSIGDARWSPDGSKIAVVGPADPGNPDEGAGAIYIMNADGPGDINLPTLLWDISGMWEIFHVSLHGRRMETKLPSPA